MASSKGQPGTVLPGQAPPFYTITSTDQAGTVVIVTAVCLAAAVVSILVRVFVLLQLGTLRLRWDDWAVALALLLAIVQTSLVQREAALGLGRTIDNVTSYEIQHIQELQFADQLFYIFSVWSCKISAALFFYRLSPKSSDRRIAQNILILIGITGIAAILVLCLVCDLVRPWHYLTTQGIVCSAPYDRWIVVSAINILSEVALACLAIKIFWPLQMRLSTKFAAGFIFLQRLTLIIPIAGQLHFLSIVYYSRDPTLQATYSTLCKEVEVMLAIVATNIQCFRPFLLATATNYGAPVDEGLSAYGYGSNTERTIELADLSRSGQSRHSTQQPSAQEPQKMRMDFSPTSESQFSARVTSGSDQMSICSDGSAEMIIQKRLDYTVRYHDVESEPYKGKGYEHNQAH